MRYQMVTTDVSKLHVTLRVALDVAKEVPTIGTAHNDKYAASLRQTAALLRGGLKLIEQIERAANGEDCEQQQAVA